MNFLFSLWIAMSDEGIMILQLNPLQKLTYAIGEGRVGTELGLFCPSRKD